MNPNLCNNPQQNPRPRLSSPHSLSPAAGKLAQQIENALLTLQTQLGPGLSTPALTPPPSPKQSEAEAAALARTAARLETLLSTLATLPAAQQQAVYTALNHRLPHLQQLIAQLHSAQETSKTHLRSLLHQRRSQHSYHTASLPPKKGG